MDERVARLQTPEDCERFAKNASARGHPELAKEARRRAVELRAEKHGAVNAAEREALKAIYAYEELLTEKNGRRTRATRTWQMIDRHGIIETIERAVNRKEEPMGYQALVKMGMADLAFESIVLRYPDLFSKDAAEIAKSRIDAWK